MTAGPALPEDVESIIKRLNSNGFEAYIVGGCVRDCILGRTPADWDIATSARPDEVKGIFEKTVDTGIIHGTVTVMTGSESFEVTTFRVDGEYGDARHPSSVEYTASIEADLGRRDFTVNAMAYHPGRGFIDPFGGMRDIEGGLIRTVGKAGDRFREDALRMLRAVRFSAQLSFSVHGGTTDAIRENCGLIRKISAERVRDELTRILVSENPARFGLLHETGLLRHIMPEFELCYATPQSHPYHVYNVAEHSLHAVDAIENGLCLRWTMLLHDVGKAVTRTTDKKGVDHFYGHPAKSEAIAGEILKRLKFDNKSIERILILIKLHDREIVPAPKAVAKLVSSVGKDIFEDLLKVRTADKLAQNLQRSAKDLKTIEKVGRVYHEIVESGRCLSLKDLAVDGNDLREAGWPQGREIGTILKRLLEAVIDEPALNTRDGLLELAKKLAKGGKP